jgi:hypothetical protein
MKPRIIERVVDSVEFFTHVFTGESGMSESGVARLCNTPRSTVNEMLKDLAAGNPRSKCLESFSGKDLWLPENGPDNSKVVRDEVCAAVIEHYAFEARNTTEDALRAYRKFGALGVRTWIQDITGWDRHCKDRIVDGFVGEEPKKLGQVRFQPDFYEILYKKRGGEWAERNPKDNKRPPCVGSWTNDVVYDRFPNGVKSRLNEVNPRINGYRKDKHHEHLKPLGSDHLDAHFYALKAVSNLSPDGDWEMFMRNIKRAFPNGEALQLNMLDLLEQYEQMDEAS